MKVDWIEMQKNIMRAGAANQKGGRVKALHRTKALRRVLYYIGWVAGRAVALIEMTFGGMTALEWLLLALCRFLVGFGFCCCVDSWRKDDPIKIVLAGFFAFSYVHQAIRLVLDARRSER